MKIFRVNLNSKYQSSGLSIPFLETYQSDYRKLGDKWRVFEFPIADPAKRRGDFVSLMNELFLVGRKTTEEFRDCVEQDMEILPTRIEGDAGEYFLWNPNNYVDAFDDDRAQWEHAKEEGYRGALLKYEFYSDRFSRPTIFRLPQLPGIYLVTGIGAPESDFYIRYNKRKMTGLSFRLVWEETSSTGEFVS